jgi:hypothetical protein
MRRTDEAAAHRERRAHDVCAEVRQRCCRADDVDDGVDRADLVEVHLFQRHLVHERLGLPEGAEDRARQRLDRSGERRRLEHHIDAREVPVGLRPLQVHVEARRHDRALVRVPAVEVETFDGERCDGLLHDEQRDAEIEQRRDGHVARHAAERIEEERLARTVAFFQERQLRRALVRVLVLMPMSRSRIMRVMRARSVAMVVAVPVPVIMPVVAVAMAMPMPRAVLVIVVLVPKLHTFSFTHTMRCTASAAPNPLSMLTTVTPLAQLVNIANSAVKPFSAVP